MYSIPKQEQTYATALSAIRSDPTNNTLQSFIDDLDKAEHETLSAMKSAKGESAKEHKDVIASVFADARQVLDLVRKR